MAGPAPFDTPDFDWFAGMDAVNVEEIGWAQEGEDVLAREIERMPAAWLERVANDPSDPGEVEFSEADRAVLADAERHEAMRRGLNEAFRQGVGGYVDDLLCVIQPWGFDVTKIRVPTRIDYGLTDVLVARQHGEWLARNVPSAEVVIDEQGGHFSCSQARRRTSRLARPAGLTLFAQRPLRIDRSCPGYDWRGPACRKCHPSRSDEKIE